MNHYATLDELKARLNLSGSANDAMLMQILEESSRAVDAATARVFYAVEAVRTYTVRHAEFFALEDMLRVDGVEVRLGEDDSDEWTALEEGEHYRVDSANAVPKIALKVIAGTRLPIGPHRIRISGLFGYGDGLRAAPRDTTEAVLSADDAVTTDVEGAFAGQVFAGQTIRVGNEDMFVESVTLSPDNARVRRGVNGTTATAHTNAPVSVWAYPPVVRSAALMHAASLFGMRASPDLIRQRIGDYEEQRRAAQNHDELLVQRLSSVRRVVGTYR